MKVCPLCKTTYDDDAEHCDDDGELLIAADDEALPDNPELKDVIQVAPDEATSMIDLEAMEDKIRERMEQRRAAEAERAALAMKEAERLDPDVTGTIDLEALDKKRKTSSGDKTSPGLEPEAGEKHEPTIITRNARQKDGGGGSKTTIAKPPRDKAKLASVALIVGGVIGAIAIAVTLSLYFLRGEPLTVISVPPGALVLIDGKSVGTSPLTTRASEGSHTIELTLAGYEPFKDVVDVPKGGTSFREPLKALPGSSVAPAELDGGTEATDGGASGTSEVARILALIAAGDLEAATSAVKAFIAQAPDDPDGDKLLAALTDARASTTNVATGDDGKAGGGKAGGGKTGDGKTGGGKTGGGKTGGGKTGGGKTGGDPPPDAPVSADKAKSARAAYEDGERAYMSGRLDDAKLRFKESIQLDPRFYLPHRSVARIYEREGNIKQARYHLKRYLDLGGPDTDLKVRRWLESHP